MSIFNLLILCCTLYTVFLFGVAWLADRLSQRGQARWLRGPVVYTLSLSIYCTAWTFYGAVGYAARSGLEFATIYLGPTLVLIGWWALLRKLVRVGRAQRITSIADLISSRFGKSNYLGGLVTVLAVIATTPYIALQLQSVTLSFAVASGGVSTLQDTDAIALWVALGLAIFAIVFGTRRLDANERHDGIVAAIAVEAVVKLVALLSVGLFVVFVLAGGVAQTLAVVDASPIADWQMQPARWAGLTFLSAAAFLCLPRMFQVLVVENSDERHLATASWAFPAYLLLMSLFVVPIAAVGLTQMPAGANPDLFVLTLPLAEGQAALATLAFLGGFSSATSMVIVAAIALATMISNHIVMPLWLRAGAAQATMSGDVRRVVILARRFSIIGIMALGYLYYRLSGGGAALAAIGLISFVGIAQILPALLGGILWRGATRIGAALGLSLGLGLWLWTLFLPSVGGLSDSVLASGPWGIGWLRPQALFGITGLDPLIHALFWSMVANTSGVLFGSILTFPSPMERLQGAAMVNVYRSNPAARGWQPPQIDPEDLLVMAQRIIGATEAQTLFRNAAHAQGRDGFLPEVDQDFLEALERELAGSVGGATAHAMLIQFTGGGTVSVEELMRVADETAQIMETSARAEAQSQELSRTAAQLREANAKLTRLSLQKDAFLSQVSHELRTPMTSIRSFSEILRDGADSMDQVDRTRFADFIHKETLRLTRLLDDLLDLSVLESGQVHLQLQTVRLGSIVDRALEGIGGGSLRISREGQVDPLLTTDPDRLAQVFINLVMNCRKYCAVGDPHLRIATRIDAGAVVVDLIDNGPGISPDEQGMIFEKFARGGDSRAAGGAGLGLAICREIMDRLGGTISYLPGQGGAAFRLRLPLAQGRAEAAE